MNDEELAELAGQVKAARLAKKWSKERAAREADISVITYKRVEDALNVHDTTRAAVISALELGGSVETTASGNVGPVGNDEFFGTIKARKPEGMSDEDFKRLLKEYEEEIEWKLDRAARER